MKEAISGLEPEVLWRHFFKISQIPRESGSEEGIRRHILDEARLRGLRSAVDGAGNVVVYIPGGLPGNPVILQSHMDMVCEKEPEAIHDFRKDPIRLVRSDQWIHAQGTTLGADNGIGVAAMLALMESPPAEHPDLELLFTVDEETGLTGAGNLDTSLLSGTTLVSLDTEEDDTFIIGCAGGRNTRLSLDVSLEDAPLGRMCVEVEIAGLAGGHSGLDIRKGRGNAIRLMARFLKHAGASVPFALASLSGGSKHNAIPRDAFSRILVERPRLDALKELAERARETFLGELSGPDLGLRVELREEITAAEQCTVAPADTARILDLLHALPHGVTAVDESLGGLVVASTNLATCGIDGARFEILTSQRSSRPSSLDDTSETIAAIGHMAGARVEKVHDYPVWRPDVNSRVLSVCRQVYEELFGTPPRVQVIHAGLECAVFARKMPGLDMISLGPAIEQAHSPSERVLIPTVEKMWRLLTTLLARLPGDRPA
jgi:dipeptidase D